MAMFTGNFLYVSNQRFVHDVMRQIGNPGLLSVLWSMLVYVKLAKQ